ncbi:hypothetical protein HYY70_05865 [Candidatus Woesearchaeota archaeon]|nr:hypothetical protein [Candidatus Woesearchaeota archaeon]
MVKTKEQDTEIFFVRVKDPNEVRRHILQILKSILEVMQRFEKFRHIRHEKIESINKLRKLLKDTNKMMGVLKLKFPQTNLRAVVVKEAPAAKKVHHKKGKKTKQDEQKQEKAPNKELTELDKLKADLSAIEGKLRSLT